MIDRHGSRECAPVDSVVLGARCCGMFRAPGIFLWTIRVEAASSRFCEGIASLEQGYATRLLQFVALTRFGRIITSFTGRSNPNLAEAGVGNTKSNLDNARKCVTFLVCSRRGYVQRGRP